LNLSGFSVPEELVGIQAYLRWERRGKQNYSPQQEKVIVDEEISTSVMRKLFVEPFVY